MITGERISITTPTTFILSDSHTLRAKKKVDGVTIEAVTIQHENPEKTLSIVRDDGEANLNLNFSTITANGTFDVQNGDLLFGEISTPALTIAQSGQLIGGNGQFTANRIVVNTAQTLIISETPRLNVRDENGLRVIALELRTLNANAILSVTRITPSLPVFDVFIQVPVVENNGLIVAENGHVNFDNAALSFLGDGTFSAGSFRNALAATMNVSGKPKFIASTFTRANAEASFVFRTQELLITDEATEVTFTGPFAVIFSNLAESFLNNGAVRLTSQILAGP
jgi:hypothetical protein